MKAEVYGQLGFPYNPHFEDPVKSRNIRIKDQDIHKVVTQALNKIAGNRASL